MKEFILALLKIARHGLTVRQLAERTGHDARVVRVVLSKLRASGQIDGYKIGNATSMIWRMRPTRRRRRTEPIAHPTTPLQVKN